MLMISQHADSKAEYPSVPSQYTYLLQCTTNNNVWQTHQLQPAAPTLTPTYAQVNYKLTAQGWTCRRKCMVLGHACLNTAMLPADAHQGQGTKHQLGQHKHCTQASK